MATLEEILVQMAHENREVLERIATLEETNRDLLTLAEYNAKKDYEIEFFTYPYDGTRATLSAGTTTIDFAQGTIRSPSGGITKLSSDLGKKKKDFLRSVTVNANEDIVVQLDENNKIPVRANNWFTETYQQFTRVKITTTTSTDVFVLASTNPKSLLDMLCESTVAVGKQTVEHVDTDKDTHFTTAIAQNAIEEENITGLSDNKITITGISLQAKEALSYRLWIFGTDGFADTDLDVDQFIKYVDFDFATANGQIAGAGQYYLAQTDLSIDYEDEDATNELHLALQNLSVAAKTADADGAVKAKISYKPRM